MDILNEKLIFLDQDIKSRDDVFSFIAKEAMANGIISDENALIQGFKNRELEGSTGFEDGFAIPHARIKEAKTAAVVVVRLKKGVDWQSIDGKATDVAIALIVPDGQGNKHMELLSDVATQLMNDEFKKQVKSAKTPAEVVKAFSIKKAATKSVAKKSKDGLNILAITACVTGVAHTYLAEEKLLKAGAELGHHIRVETHGSKGVGTPFSAKEVAEADLVIFAVDTGVDKSRFGGKKTYEIKVAKAIHDPEGVINDAQSKGVVMSGSSDGNVEIKSRESVMKHILAGVSYMIPVIVLGGICLAFSLGIAKAIWGPSAAPDNGGKSPWGILNVLNIIGGVAFSLMIPILAGFIGNSIAGRAAIAPAMVAGFIGNSNSDLMPWPNIPGLETIQTPMGFIGAIIAGLAAGYLVKWINTWKVPRALQAAMPIFFIPLFVGLILSLAFIYVLGSPIGYVMNKIQYGIERGYGYNPDTETASGSVGVVTGILLGLLLGAMGGLDMGGPINKIAFVTCSFLTAASADQTGTAAEILQRPMGSLACAIPVAPLGMGIATFVLPNKFDKESRSMGVGAFIMGCIGISEGAIPFAIRDPKRAIVCNVLGSAVAGALGGAMGVQDAAAHGGPIVAVLGAVPYGVQTLYYFIAAGAGVAVTSLVYIFWMLADAGKPGSVKETHVNKLALLNATFKDKKAEIKENISALKNEYAAKIKQTKNEGKDASSLVNERNAKIASLKQEIADAKATFKAAVAKAKSAYKAVASKEKAEMKQQSVSIKETRMGIKSTYKNEVLAISQKASSKSSFANKAEKVSFKGEISAAKAGAKDTREKSMILDSTKRRQSFVNEYNKLAA